jgi:hypothetical protein
MKIQEGGCNFNQEHSDFLYAISVIFGDEFIFQTIAFSWKLSWRNSKQDEIHHFIAFLCVPVILLRHVWILSFKNLLTSI